MENATENQYIRFLYNHNICKHTTGSVVHESLHEMISFNPNKKYLISLPVKPKESIISEYIDFANHNVGVWEVLDERLWKLYQKVANSKGHSLKEAQIDCYRTSVYINNNKFTFKWVYWNPNVKTYSIDIFRNLTLDDAKYKQANLVSQEDLLTPSNYELNIPKTKYVPLEKEKF
jgi:hypothetical protein